MSYHTEASARSSSKYISGCRSQRARPVKEDREKSRTLVRNHRTRWPASRLLSLNEANVASGLQCKRSVLHREDVSIEVGYPLFAFLSNPQIAQCITDIRLHLLAKEIGIIVSK